MTQDPDARTMTISLRPPLRSPRSKASRRLRRGRERFVAVEGVDLTLGAREFVALVGPTGCGKSSLLNLLAGLSAPDAGRVLVGGAPLDGLNRGAGYLFQQDALMPWKTARANVAVALEPPASAARRRGGAPTNGSRASGSPPSARAIRTRSRAASGSAWLWRRC